MTCWVHRVMHTRLQCMQTIAVVVSRRAPMSAPGMSQARGNPMTAIATVPQNPSHPITCNARES